MGVTADRGDKDEPQEEDPTPRWPKTTTWSHLSSGASPAANGGGRDSECVEPISRFASNVNRSMRYEDGGRAPVVVAVSRSDNIARSSDCGGSNPHVSPGDYGVRTVAAAGLTSKPDSSKFGSNSVGKNGQKYDETVDESNGMMKIATRLKQDKWSMAVVLRRRKELLE